MGDSLVFNAPVLQQNEEGIAQRPEKAARPPPTQKRNEVLLKQAFIGKGFNRFRIMYDRLIISSCMAKHIAERGSDSGQVRVLLGKAFKD